MPRTGFRVNPLYSWLNVKELLAQNRREIWSLSDCNWLSVRLRTKWLWVPVQLQSLEVLDILQKECEPAINCFKTNNMIVNPDKFQSMTISSKKDLTKSVLNKNGVELTMKSSLKLLGIEIDNKLNFEKHISNIFQKTQQSTKCNLQTANIYGS